MAKVSSKKDLVSFLKSQGFTQSSGGKHEKWTKSGYQSIFLPRDGKGFSRVMGERLIKSAGLWEVFQSF